jgi:hypothetical protein
VIGKDVNRMYAMRGFVSIAPVLAQREDWDSGIMIMGVRLTSHWTAALLRAFCSSPDESEWVNVCMNEKTFFFNFRKCGAHGGIIFTAESWRTLRKTCPSATLSTTNPTGLTRAQTRDAAVRGQLLSVPDLSSAVACLTPWETVSSTESMYHLL